MASRNKVPRRKAHPITSDMLTQFGIPEIPNFDEDDDEVHSDVDDSDLESELQALLSGRSVTKPLRKPNKEMNFMDVEKMASECLKDDSVDEDENLSGDEELLGELKALTGHNEDVSEIILLSPNEDDVSDLPKPPDSAKSIISLLEERLSLYKEAESAAKVCGDSSKVRRYGRAIKTLESQLRSAKFGHVVKEEDIPPLVTVAVPKVAPTSEISDKTISPPPPPLVPSRPAPKLPDPAEQAAPLQTSGTNVPASGTNVPASSINSQLIERRSQYKRAALRAKKCGDNETALMYVKIAKKFDNVIEAEQNGQPIDLSNMPPPPSKYSDNVQTSATAVPAPPLGLPRVQTEETQYSSDSGMEKAALEAANEPADPSLFNAPPPPASILEALQQRLEKYCSTRDAAKAEGNNSKARRLQRIVQQYESAIKNYKAGKPVDFDDLPAPPGFAPIPIENSSSTKPLPEPTETLTEVLPEAVPEVPAKTQPAVPPKTAKQLPSSASPKTIQSPNEQPQRSSSERHPKVQRTNTSSILDKQLQFLLERQKLFRQAALESKKNGDIQQAKEYLRMSKGFDSMIEATKCGLPIDATTIPTPPQLETDFVVIDKSECFNADSSESNNLFPTLEKELQHQIEMCDRNKNHFMSLGDVSSASKFEKFSLDSKKDLILIQHLWRNGENVPRFHFEMRVFSLVQCNTDLADSDLEVTIERGINFPGKPEELDSYIRIELPIPAENPQRAKTHTVRDTNNPIFQEVFKFEINRKSRAQLRQFKRQALKCEVWSKGGFFRGDSLLGTVSVKLVDLETKCCVNNSFDLMHGRKACGGRLEVKMRIRDPLLNKQVEEVREKWLVIDNN